MNRVKVLIVEDELLVAEQIASYLRNAKYEVLDILDKGEDAVEFLKKDSPDLILMDIELNGEMDGVEAAIRIQEQIYIPVVYLTKLNDIRTLNRVKTTMPAAYLTKPFKNHDIRNAIEMAVYKGIHNHLKDAKHEIKVNIELDMENNDGAFKQMKDRIFYKGKSGSLLKLLLQDIVYLEMEGQNLIAHTLNGSFPIYSNLKQFFEKINNSSLFRIHRKYAINMNYLFQIFDQYVVLNYEIKNENLPDPFQKCTKLPIGKTYKKDFMSLIENKVL